MDSSRLVAGALSTGAAVAFGEDVTNLGLWVRFAATIIEITPVCISEL
jgi:hypothetical protein